MTEEVKEQPIEAPASEPGVEAAPKPTRRSRSTTTTKKPAEKTTETKAAPKKKTSQKKQSRYEKRRTASNAGIRKTKVEVDLTRRKCLPYELASKYVQSQSIKSSYDFSKWHKQNKPEGIPAYPNRAYSNEWVSWNHFLGTSNVSFGGKANHLTDEDDIRTHVFVFRNYDDTAAWARKMGIKTEAEWVMTMRRPDTPKDIHTRPDLHFAEWKGWRAFFGLWEQQAEEAQKQISTQVLYIMRLPGVPANVMVFGVEDAGLSAVRDKLASARADVIALFWNEPERFGRVKDMIDRLSRPYYADERQRIVDNASQLIWYIQTELRLVMPSEWKKVFPQPQVKWTPPRDPANIILP